MLAARPGLAFMRRRFSGSPGLVRAIAMERGARSSWFDRDSWFGRLCLAWFGRLCLVCLALIALTGPAACDRENGQIELNWTVVDRAGTQIAPFGVLGDTCDFSGKLAAADTEPSNYDLVVRLRLCDSECAGGCDDPTCEVVKDLRYGCGAARGFSTVPARTDTPYDIEVDLVATPQSGACGCALTPPCALVPGPRRRTVEPGLVTDLQVYLLVLGLDNIRESREDGRPRLD
ncbi:MAG: hypothetical protein H0T76_06325, partial [Nannocystis sp.]